MIGSRCLALALAAVVGFGKLSGRKSDEVDSLHPLLFGASGPMLALSALSAIAAPSDHWAVLVAGSNTYGN